MSILINTASQSHYWLIQVVAKQYTLYHKSFEAEKFHSKLYMQIFIKKLLWNLSYFLLNPY